MKPLLIAALIALPLMGCKTEETAALPPETMTAEAIGRYCGMNLMEHEGPKGQVVLSREMGAYWFSSARDTIAFSMMPDEVKDYGGLYVSDMARAESWAEPGADNWIDAKTAFYVTGSSAQGGMGGAELVPFSTREAAEAFAAEKGGIVQTFDELTPDEVLGNGTAAGGEHAAN
ncbi:copper chaperone NosL [Paracoccus halophilus]|uniref:Copper chaperone n=1 Tax=Paracoccus halophilus TaxID=376733 RepID=A0A099F1N6_9RHOB|nr:nitrous oxide reductase accessory protein NosL [Paracoccus halophilus]KGJ04364.1 copper chaperone [Paracoccus halophilus]SFA55092.1 copper chaperone NosL [Paracoccus halophilus]